MYKCYDARCINEVSEEFTLCEPCKEKYYPTKIVGNIAEKVRALAATAPKKVIVPQIVLSPKPTDKLCSLCTKKKKHAVVVPIEGTDFAICWSHKLLYEKSYGINWKITALHMCQIKVVS